MQVWFPERTQSAIPLWMRLFAGLFSLIIGILLLLKHPQGFNWVPQLCLGIWFLFLMPPLRTPSESRREYWKKPRVLVSSLLLAIVIVASALKLYTLFRR